MAIEHKKFTIALCGFSESEEKSLGRAFQLSEVRPRHYIPWSQGQDRPDICVLNEDIAAGVQDWTALRNTLPGAIFPVMRVGITNKTSHLFDGTVNVFFKRPVLANRILKALDDLVADFYHFSPETDISDTMSAQVVAAQVEQPAPALAASAKRILVVDDSESVRKMMEVRLGMAGFAVDFAETGEEALTKARDYQYDLIFLDVMLPGISGYEVSRTLKKKLRVKAPVVMLTGKTSRFDKLRGTLASADVYLTKPLTIDQLNATLQRYLK
ncbi:response regulator transcription factor [uncultured Thiodictyon sp.]|uniref:response regulator transcription factor n=1 Tax=uncultured Thiodictyon sp. TaxID=1846217 RepID=UPI0025DE9E4E|nr:response regulator [uncultured Thiodictyon sp.]